MTMERCHATRWEVSRNTPPSLSLPRRIGFIRRMASIVPSPDAGRPQRGVFTAAILVLSNLVPLAGILWWGWDVFVLLCLYWLETAAIGFWTVLRVAALSQTRGNAGARGIAGALALAGFFTVHGGLFMTVHMVFLFVLFAGAWAERIHDARDFIRLIVIGSGLWIPLLALFAGQGALFVNDAVNRFAFAKPPAEASAAGIVGGFYKRIVLMHVAILGGAFIVQAIGNVAPLIILVLLKTVLEIALLMPWRRGAA